MPNDRIVPLSPPVDATATLQAMGGVAAWISNLQRHAPIVPVVARPAEPSEHPLYQLVLSAIARASKSDGIVPTTVKRTRVNLVLDESRSMVTGKDVTIAGFNQQLELLQHGADDTGKTTLSLFKFASQVRAQFQDVSVSAVPPLTSLTYTPEGGTALFDAIGAAIEHALSASDWNGSDSATLISILTDGEERDSRYVTNEVLKLCIAALQATGKFTFAIMGPKENISSLADILNVSRGNVAGFDTTSVQGRSSGMEAMAGATATYMSSRAMGATSTMSMYSDPNS